MSTTRKVTIVSTKNNKVKFYETAATTWGELNAEINNDFDLSNLKATENVNKTTLEHVDAVLPTGEFRVFLRPVKTKSGQDFDTMKFGDLRATFKNDDAVKKFLTDKVSSQGRNWTQLKTDELRSFLKEYHSTAVSNVVSSVAESKVEDAVVEEVQVQGTMVEASLNVVTKLEKAISLLQDVFNEITEDGTDEDEEVLYRINEFLEEKEEILEFVKEAYPEHSSSDSVAPSVSTPKVETEEERIAREQKEAEDKEIADALSEARDFSSGFTN